MRAANLALRFLLELAALAAFAYWGASSTLGMDGRVVLAVVLPLAAAVFWGVFV